MRVWLRNMQERFRGSLAARDPWTEFDGPWSLILLLAASLPLLLSGPVRAVSSLSLPLSLVVATLFVALVLTVVGSRLRRRAVILRTDFPWSVEVGALVVVGAGVWALYIRDFGGFPNLDGWDGGSHVVIKDMFAAMDPGLYNGQVAYYALAWWLERLFGLDSFRSFALAFYIAVAITVAVPLAVGFSVVRSAAGNFTSARIAGTFVLVAGSLGGLWMVVLPLLHYNQGAGYYVHVFGFVPLLLVWAADALIRHQAVRVVTLLAGLVLLRYSYALNLADAALAVAAVLTLEGFRGAWRGLQAILVVVLVAAVLFIVPALRPIFLAWGGMQRFDVDSVLGADLTIAGLALLYAAVSACRGLSLDWLRTPLGRALRFPVAFALANTELLAILRQAKGVRYYYVTKYPMWACMLLAFVVAMLLGHWAAAILRKGAWRRPTLWLGLALLTALLATVPRVWAKTFLGYRTSLAERVLARGPTYQSLHALADVEAIARIKGVLGAEHKHFGGYLTAFFPMFSFMNATLGYHSGRQEFFPPNATPGHCVFWVAPQHDIYRLGPAQVLDGLRSSIATANSPCVEYAVPWKPSAQSLCYRCY